MAADPRKRQKKLQRRAGKRQEKKRAIVKAQNAGLGDKLAKAARFPILHAFVTEPLWSHGMGSLLVSRQLPGGRVAFGSFLIDRYCLGVKDAFGDIFSDDEYAEIMVRKTRDRYAIVELTPATARGFVESAVAYAAHLGFPPHPDYHKVKAIFGDIDAGEAAETLEFGKDGRPHFIAGPDDGPARCRQIISILVHRCGEDGYHYSMPVFGDAFDDEEGEEGEEDDIEDEGDDGEEGEGPVILLDEDEVRRLPKQ